MVDAFVVLSAQTLSKGFLAHQSPSMCVVLHFQMHYADVCRLGCCNMVGSSYHEMHRIQ